MRTLLLYLLILFSFYACDEIIDGDGECPENASCLPTEAMMQSDLDSMKIKILELAQSSPCSDDAGCQYAGLGSKPCGGPWEYLIYSSSVDTITLNYLIDEYNQLESNLNITYGRGSDCAVANEPDSVICSNEGCIGYSQGEAFSNNLCCD